MGWKEDLQNLVETTNKLLGAIVKAQAQLVIQNRKLDDLKNRIEVLERTSSRSVDRMADRMIEMAMVNQGLSKDAAIHRRALGEEENAPSDPWQDTAEEEWPPSGCDALSMP